MTDDSIWRTVAANKRAKALERRWQRLCALHLPRAPKGSMWRYHCATSRGAPASGWKLHISATILNAATTLERIAPVLARCGVQFKAPRSLVEVMKLNSGLHHTYSQIGKVITVYPRDENEAVNLAERLHQLTRRLDAPSVPFDSRFADSSNVYYRYGALSHFEITLSNGKRVSALKSPSGKLVRDVRERAKPAWVRDPFAKQKSKCKTHRGPPELPFRVLRALVQRGKGGVYQAIDLRGKAPQLCLLKEGRRSGETCWDGRDGAWRVRHEERVLQQLSAGGVTVPEVYSAFELQGNYYLAMKFIDGETFQDLLNRLQRRMPVARVLSYGIQLATFLSRMHKAGWAWRDCKPKNIIVTCDGRLVPIDFEGAAPIDRPDHVPWGTLGFTPPDWGKTGNGEAGDVYALGSVLYLLLTGRVFDHAQPIAIQKLRRNAPAELRQLVESLLSERPETRPPAKATAARLTSILLSSSRQPMCLRDAKAA
jgi:class IV lanthipeptide synthase